VRRLELTESARADLTSIRRYSLRSWGTERTDRYMMALRDAMKDLVSGRGVGREREDLRPRLRMTASGRHCISLRQTVHECL
jgi:toxin ParE1/3/4